MSRINIQNVCGPLTDLQEHPDYKAFTDPAIDGRAHDFRQLVDTIVIRCLSLPPEEATEKEIQQLLSSLHNATIGTFYRFRPFVEKAQATLEGKGQ